MVQLFKNAVLPEESAQTDLRVENGVIAQIGAGLPAQGADEVYDLEGRVLSPGFCDIHTHLDKAYTYDLLEQNASGTLDEAIGNFYGAVNRFSEDDFYQRGQRMLDNALLNGTLYLRSHITISPVIGLRAIKAMARLKRDYAHLMDVQIVAFPGDEPTGMSAAVKEMAIQAFAEGADIVGGTPNRYTDERAFIDDLFDIAKTVDRDMDLHVDEKDEPAVDALEYYADQALARGFAGRVTVGHATALAAVDEDTACRVIDKIAAAGMTVVTLPSCNLYLMGRSDKGLVRRGPTRVRELLDAGVNVATSSDNVRDPFRPFGNADMLEETLLTAQVTRMDTPPLLAQAWKMATYNPAKAMKIERYGLAEGDNADFVALEAGSIPDALLCQSEKAFIVRRGKVIAKKWRSVEKNW